MGAHDNLSPPWLSCSTREATGHRSAPTTGDVVLLVPEDDVAEPELSIVIPAPTRS